jgi:hypothetical protein
VKAKVANDFLKLAFQSVLKDPSQTKPSPFRGLADHLLEIGGFGVAHTILVQGIINDHARSLQYLDE